MILNPSPLDTCRYEGCTLTGALSVTTHVRDAVTVVHGPKGCTHHNFSLLHATSLDNDRVVVPNIVSSNLLDTDIVFGGEPALEMTLDAVSKKNPSAIFVLSTCIVETIGDDVAMVCGADRSVPVIPVPTAGFLGGTFQNGVNNALIALAGMAPPCTKNRGVNIIGEKNLEYEVDENFSEVRRLLDALGLGVNTRFVHDFQAGAIAELGAAQVNILRDPGLIPVGEYLRQRFGTPYIPSFPVGMAATIEFLTTTALACGVDCRTAVAEEQALQDVTLSDFSDLSGSSVSCDPAGMDPAAVLAVHEMADALRMHLDPSGHALCLSATSPVGSAGVRRMLHRWRRAIHA
ncbi:MAG: nitrogenase component 1 [Methanoregula sp.]|jgi:nitrogenase molybdenum-iron protein alpha/beta subunit